MGICRGMSAHVMVFAPAVVTPVRAPADAADVALDLDGFDSAEFVER